MDNPDTSVTVCTRDTRRRQTKKKKNNNMQKTENISITDPTKNRGSTQVFANGK